ncbi:MAG: nodulation protein NfeD [Chlorobi bacterium]|nr:nodulation protein NfeD [Chlorobiota bacterium]
MRGTVFITKIAVCILAFSSLLSAQSRVTVVTIDGSINPASASYIIDALDDAEKAGDAALVLELNTPGGLLQSTRDIVSAFLSARIPIVVYVTPRGGQAASAGVFITLAANIAAMAPGTNIGAAHPVFGQGGDVEDSTNIMMTKVTNDAAAFARTIAEKRGRNIKWSELAVRKSVSLTETEALEDSVIDLVAGSLEELLKTIDGDSVETAAGMVAVSTADADIARREMSLKEEVLDILSDPNIAYILMMLGIYGLFFELYNPGSILPGVVGGICLILAFYSLNTLPVNYAGLALILFGIILFILEIKIVSHGILSIGGVIALFMGSLMLIDTPEGMDFMTISLSVIITVTACTAAFFLFVVGKGIQAMRRKPTTGKEGLVGETGVVVETLAPRGKVLIHGEYWNAVTESGEIAEGEEVVVNAVKSLLLIVSRKQP